jgi:hypothetical protein
LAGETFGATIASLRKEDPMIAMMFAAALALPTGLPTSTMVACQTRPVQASETGPASLLRPQDRAAIRMLKLGDLPKANKEIAVARYVGGCAVPVGIAYRVEGDGRFASGPR